MHIIYIQVQFGFSVSQSGAPVATVAYCTTAGNASNADGTMSTASEKRERNGVRLTFFVNGN